MAQHVKRVIPYAADISALEGLDVKKYSRSTLIRTNDLKNTNKYTTGSKHHDEFGTCYSSMV